MKTNDYKKNLFNLKVIKRHNREKYYSLICHYHDTTFNIDYTVDTEKSCFKSDDCIYIESVSSYIDNSLLNTYGSEDDAEGSTGISYWDTDNFKGINLTALIICFENEIHNILCEYIENAKCTKEYQQSLRFLMCAISDKRYESN